MHTMHSTLLIGHYDWEPERLPKEEFDERLDALWKKLPSDVAAIAVYGDRRANAEIAYLTNFVPKLRDGMAVIPREGEPKLYVTGSPKMMATAGRQTWIKSLQPLSEPGKALAEWKAKGPIVFVGGENLRLALRKGVDEIVAGDASKIANDAVKAFLRGKRAKELAAIRQGCAILKAMSQALAEAHKAGKSATDALLEAEHTGHKMGAMEVRTLMSFDGGRTLRPYMVPVEKPADPIVAYMAVRSNGYWSEGYVTFSKADSPAKAKAAEALKAMIAAAKAGASAADIARKAPANQHPVVASGAGGGIGLSMDEEPRLKANCDAKIEAGHMLSLRAGVSEGGSHAIVSAMVAITASGNEVLWS